LCRSLEDTQYRVIKPSRGGEHVPNCKSVDNAPLWRDVLPHPQFDDTLPPNTPPIRLSTVDRLALMRADLEQEPPTANNPRAQGVVRRRIRAWLTLLTTGMPSKDRDTWYDLLIYYHPPTETQSSFIRSCILYPRLIVTTQTEKKLVFHILNEWNRLLQTGELHTPKQSKAWFGLLSNVFYPMLSDEKYSRADTHINELFEAQLKVCKRQWSPINKQRLDLLTWMTREHTKASDPCGRNTV
jgi:hypothetical protein